MRILFSRATPEQMQVRASAFYNSLGYFGKILESIRYEPPRSRRIFMRHAWLQLVHEGTLLAQAVLGTKEIPAGKQRELEVAARLFMAARRISPDPVAWYDKNAASMNFLYDAATQWQDKTEASTEQMLKIGPFTVHNTIGLSGPDLEGIKTAIEKVVSGIQTSAVPGISSILYGDIMIVGRISQSKNVAWYYPNEDTLYVRHFGNAGVDEVQTTGHELGHRYWLKFMPGALKIAWHVHHNQISGKTPSYSMPNAGEPMPLKIKGIKGYPTILKIENQKYWFEAPLGRDPQPHLLAVPVMAIARALADEKRKIGFPTRYAAKNAEEHFCESLGLRIAGQLKDEHLKAFEVLAENKNPLITAGYGAQRMAGTYVRISREDLETWLATIPMHSKWSLMQGRVGTYLLPLSDVVAVKLSSTIGSNDDAMGRVMASMQLSLISTVTKQVLNKKAQGQNHFARTTNWQKNWKEGVERMRDAYQKSQGFYDALAMITDREKYQKDLLALIESSPTWKENTFLADLHKRVEQGGILTKNQEDALNRAIERAPKPLSPDTEALIERYRSLYRAAQGANDRWLMDFLTSAVVPAAKAGRPLSPRQQEVLDKNLARYRVAARHLA